MNNISATSFFSQLRAGFSLIARDKSLLAIALFIVLIDQATKWWLITALPYGHSFDVWGEYARLTHVHNYGAAFGMFGQLAEALRLPLLAVTTAGAILLVVYFLGGAFGGLWRARIAFSLVLGGALGNVIDRVRLGYVTDFLDFGMSSYRWPAFNIADSAICIGVVLLLLLPSHHVQE